MSMAIYGDVANETVRGTQFEEKKEAKEGGEGRGKEIGRKK